MACAIGSVRRSAAGAFAPGHLGELTQIVPFEIFNEVLAETRSVQRRLRQFLAGGGVSAAGGGVVRGAGFWSGVGAAGVGSGRAGVGAVVVGAVPGPPPGGGRAVAGVVLVAGRSARGAVRWLGLLVCAVDGTTMSVLDSLANLAAYGHQSGSHGGSGYPLVRLVAVVACGTRTLWGGLWALHDRRDDLRARAVRLPEGGDAAARRLQFAVKALVTAIAGPQGTGADSSIRCKSTRPLPRLETLADRSWCSVLAGCRSG